MSYLYDLTFPITSARLVQEGGPPYYISRESLESCNINDADVCMIRGGWEERFWQKAIQDKLVLHIPSHIFSVGLAITYQSFKLTANVI